MKPAEERPVSRRRTALLAVLFSLLFAFFQTGRTLVPPWPWQGAPSSGEMIGRCAGAGILSLVLGSAFFVFNSRWSARHQSARSHHRLPLWQTHPGDRLFYWGMAGLLLLGWLPVFLAYYPGIFAYDVEGQLAMQPGSFTNWHPLIHTLYLKLFYDGIGTGLLHNATAGIALAAAVQMIVFALQIAILPLTLRRMGVSRTGQVLASVFLMFCPSVSVMAISLTKDVFFSGFFVCVLCQTIALSLDAGWSGRPGHRILFGVCVAGLILFRNTGLYIMLGFGIAAAAVWLIQKRYQTLVALICGILGAMLVSTSLMAITRAGKVVYNDPYSVPIQQIASVCTREKETMDPALRSEIEDLIPDVDQFNPYNSDPVRVWSRLMALEKSRYIQVWLRLARQYPLEMVQAFLLLTQAYWYLDDTSLVRIYHWDQGQEGYGYYQSYTADGFGVHPHSLLPGLKEACEHLFQHPDYAYLHLWPLNWLCAPAAYVWLLLFCLLSALCDHNRRAGLPLWLCVLLCATLFLSPCALLRYALPLMVAAPALIAIAFYRFERTKLPSGISL